MLRRLLVVAFIGLALTLAACGSSSGSSGGIQGGGNGSGDAAPGEPSGGGGIQSGGLSGGGGGGGTAGGTSSSGGTLSAYDPVGRPLRCMRRNHLPAYRDGVGAIQIAPKGKGPRVVFASTTGDAQAAQIHGQAEGAEIIGTALLYVSTASDRVIKLAETCLDQTPY